MNYLLALAIIALFPWCAPSGTPAAPPGMPLEREHRPDDPGQSLTRNLTADHAHTQ